MSALLVVSLSVTVTWSGGELVWHVCGDVAKRAVVRWAAEGGKVGDSGGV